MRKIKMNLEVFKDLLSGRLFLLERDAKSLPISNHGLNGQIKELKSIILILKDVN